MEKFTKLTSRIIALPVNNIDTDQIIPARFLKVTDKSGLGDNLFADWRYEADGSPKKDFVLNLRENRGAQVLLAGDNFGCGSSREHAPWALVGYGLKAVISTSFADIFYNNALKNGLLLVKVDQAAWQALLEMRSKDPTVEVEIDLEAQTLKLPGGALISFPMDSFSRLCLLNGTDQLEYILAHVEQINQYEQTRGLV